MTALAKAIDATVARSNTILRQDYDQDGLPKEVLDLIEFGRILVRIANGMDLAKAMGAPGDWGYESPIATAMMKPNNSDGKHFCRFASSFIGDKSVGKVRGERLHGVVLAANGGIGQRKCRITSGIWLLEGEN